MNLKYKSDQVKGRLDYHKKVSILSAKKWMQNESACVTSESETGTYFMWQLTLVVHSNTNVWKAEIIVEQIQIFYNPPKRKLVQDFIILFLAQSQV